MSLSHSLVNEVSSLGISCFLFGKLFLTFSCGPGIRVSYAFLEVSAESSYFFALGHFFDVAFGKNEVL